MKQRSRVGWRWSPAPAAARDAASPWRWAARAARSTRSAARTRGRRPPPMARRAPSRTRPRPSPRAAARASPSWPTAPIRQAASVFDRVRREQGRLDVLANAVWGGHDDVRHARRSGGRVESAVLGAAAARQWATMMTAGPCAYYLMSAYAIPLMLERRGGLIVGLTDGIADDGKGGSADEIVLGRRAIRGSFCGSCRTTASIV